MKETRTELYRMAEVIVAKAIATPNEEQRINGYKSCVTNNSNRLFVWHDEDNWGYYDLSQREQVQQSLTDAWEQEQGGPVYEPDDDDTPTMPTLDIALARLAMESPEAARAARNFLKGTSELRTVVVRFLVSERERTQIEDGMKAAGIDKISEYCRGKVLSEGQSIMRSDAYRPQS